MPLEGYLYAVTMLITDHPFNPVKVGFSTDPDTRLSKHYGGGPYPVEVIGTWEGTKEDEKAFHKRYAERRLSGEWFCPTDAMMEEIVAHAYTPKQQALYRELQEGKKRLQTDPEYRAEQWALAAASLERSGYSREDISACEAKANRSLGV